MPDFRYRQTTATLDVCGFEFRASGGQPIDLGWRAAFPDWRPADEKGDEAQLLPPLRNGETAQLHDPTIEDEETRPPSRYNEGTLIEAMQNAWRFVDDEVLRERLKEAKGIGTPATRAEIIGGLRKQGFLVAQGKHIVPTEAGLSLFGVLKQADPALVDRGVTAQLECLLDDVVVGKQEMVGAIDAVCDVAERIIGKLNEGNAAGGPLLLGATVGNGHGTFPPTPAMKRFADSLARQKGIKPPPGYKTSISICRKFLSEHAPKKAEGETPGKPDAKPVSPAQMLYAKKIAREACRSRGGQGQLGCHVRVDKLEPKREAPQARQRPPTSCQGQRHLPHVVAECNQLARHIVRRHAGLDTNQARRNIRKPGPNPAAAKLLTQNDRSPVIQPDQMQRVLACINAHCAGDYTVRLLRHGACSSCF